MSNEILRQPDQAERELVRLIEAYRESSMATLETYVYYGVAGDEKAIEKQKVSRALFLNGGIRNPELPCPLVEEAPAAEMLINYEHELLGFMKDSIRLDYNNYRERALYDILRTSYLEVAMLQISRQLLVDKTLTVLEREELADMFNLANDEVYGYLNPAQFNGVLRQVSQNSQKALEDATTPAAVKNAAGYLSSSSPYDESMPIEEQIIPDSTEIDVLQKLMYEANTDLTECIPQIAEDETMSLEEFVGMFRRAHEIRKTGWGVRVELGKNIVDTRQSEKTTVIGADRTMPGSRAAATKVLLHENGIHVERRMQGDSLGDPLFEKNGLAGYLTNEEGLAKIFEELVDGEANTTVNDYFVTLGWARGMDGAGRRDFRGVFELEWRRLVVKAYVESPDDFNDSSVNKAQDQAYNHCVRIFRGSPCDIPGMVYTKDQSYYVGQQNMRKYLIAMTKLPDEERRKTFAKLLWAKYDPTNDLHCKLLDEAAKGMSHVN